MPTEIGRKTIVGIGKEATFGTKAATITYFPCETFNPNPQTETIREEGMFGRKETSLKGACVAKKWAEPSFDGIAYDNLIGILLAASLGTDTKTGANPYTHTFSVLQTAIPSYTIVYKDGNVTKMMTGSVLSSLEVNQDTGEFLRYSASFVSKFPETTTETPAIAAENKFCSKFASVKLEETVAALGNGTAIAAESFRITLEKGAESLYKFGSADPAENYDKGITITGEFVLNMGADTYLTLNGSGASKALQFETINTDAAGNPTLRFILNAIVIDDWGRNGGKDERVTQTCGFTASYDLADSEAIEAVLINAVNPAY